MASETIIKAGITGIVNAYALWAIGLTNDPVQRESEIGSQMGWRVFEADTGLIAQNVEVHFVSKGMQADSVDRAINPTYVYIFMGLGDRLDYNRSSPSRN